MMTLKEALDIRIPQVTDKNGAVEKLQEYVESGELTATEAQGYVDIMYPILYELEYDEEGNVISETALNEQHVVEFAEANPYMTLQEQVDLLTLEVLELKGEI